MTSWIPFWRTSTIAVELCEKVLLIMDDVVNDMNKDGVDILGGDGLQVKGYEGNNGDVLPKDAVTNELTWGKVNIPDNSIFSSMIVNGTIQFEDKLERDNSEAGTTDTSAGKRQGCQGPRQQRERKNKKPQKVKPGKKAKTQDIGDEKEKETAAEKKASKKQKENAQKKQWKKENKKWGK